MKIDKQLRKVLVEIAIAQGDITKQDDLSVEQLNTAARRTLYIDEVMHERNAKMYVIAPVNSEEEAAHANKILDSLEHECKIVLSSSACFIANEHDIVTAKLIAGSFDFPCVYEPGDLDELFQCIRDACLQPHASIESKGRLLTTVLRGIHEFESMDELYFHIEEFESQWIG